MEAVSELRKEGDINDYCCKVNVEYNTLDRNLIVTKSKNTMHIKKDYHKGQLVEILYREDNPQIFYLVDDKNFKRTDAVILRFGLFVCVLGLC